MEKTKNKIQKNPTNNQIVKLDEEERNMWNPKTNQEGVKKKMDK